MTGAVGSVVNVTFTLVIAESNAALDMRMDCNPEGATKSIEMSCGKLWLMFENVTLTCETSPAILETNIGEGYGLAGPLSGFGINRWSGILT